MSRIDGYLKDEVIKILILEKIQKAADVLIQFGFEKEVDRFIRSMNRAAEKAAPAAMSIFIDSIKDMTFSDARSILNGGDTAATDYFWEKASQRLFEAFIPIISSSMNEEGVTEHYKKMMSKYDRIPLMESIHVDLDKYITDEALEGLFYMVGEEEKKIRKDPTARVTELLQKVFRINNKTA